MVAYVSRTVTLPIEETSAQTITIVPRQKDTDIPNKAVVYLSKNAFQKISNNFYKVVVREIRATNHDCLLDARDIASLRLANLQGKGSTVKIFISPSQEEFVPRDIAAAELVVETASGEQRLGSLKNVGILKPEAYKALQGIYVGFLQEVKKMMAENKSGNNVAATPKAVKA